VNTSEPQGNFPGRGGPGQFTEEEVAQAAEGPATDEALDELEPANIDAPANDPDVPFDNLVARGKRTSAEKIRAVLESLLLVADRPLSLDQLFEATGFDRAQMQSALEGLAADRRDAGSGIVLHEVGGGWQLRTDPESAEYVRRFLRVKPQRLTRAAVETLAIIAYRQPVTRPEVEDVRAVDCGAVIKALLERKLIKILGKKEEPGRPILYGTTQEFLEFFALRDLASLPTLREFQELSREHMDIVEKETPSKPQVAGTVAALADPTFQSRLDDTQEESENALAELEQAISTADQRSKAAAKILEPPPAPPTGEGESQS
jgi:segregation and condensation protein B